MQLGVTRNIRQMVSLSKLYTSLCERNLSLVFVLRIEKASLFPHDTVPRATQICVKPFRLSTLSHSAILFIGSSLHPQALILLKIAPAARTYGLHLCSEECFISLVFRILFPLSLKRASSIYVLRSCFIKRPGIKYIKHLRAAVCKYREFAVKAEISKYFIFSQEKPFGEIFSKITIKVSKGFSFSRKSLKSEMLPHVI